MAGSTPAGRSFFAFEMAEAGEGEVGLFNEFEALSVTESPFSDSVFGSWNRAGIGELLGGRGVPFSNLAKVAGSG